MNGKKTIPLLVIATLMLSLLPSILFTQALVLSPPHLTATSGVKGDEIHVTGTNGEIPAGTTVQLYWDDSTIAWNGVKGLLNSTNAKANGNYEVWFDVPESVGGTHYIWLRTTTGGISDVTSATFTVGPSISASPSAGLPGDNVIFSMYGYPEDAEITISNGTTWATATANSLGTATKTVKIPSPLSYGSKILHISNGTATADYTFVVGPVLTVSPTAATVGSVILLTGRGFTYGESIDQGEVRLIRGNSSSYCYITTTTPVDVDPNGRVRLNVVVPFGDEEADDYTIAISSVAGSASADFEITGLTEVTVTPAYGPVASTITVTGKNYPKIADAEITVELDDGTTIGIAKTLADGTFSKTFKVPAATEGPTKIWAFTDKYDTGDDVGFKVGSMNILLSDDSGPTGLTPTLTGNGFYPNGEYNVTFGDETIIESAFADGDGLIDDWFYVPQLPVGTYTVTVWDVESDIKLTTPFEITKTTAVTLGVPSAPNGFNVTLTGTGFSDNDEGPLNVLIYNKTNTGTADWWMTVYLKNNADGVIDAVTDDEGNFKAYWIVEDADTMDQGNYYFNVTDYSGDYSVTVPFAVGAANVVCAPRLASFKLGDTISFNIEHSFGNTDPIYGSVIKIYNPSGALVFNGDGLTTWVKTGLWYTAPYSSQTAGYNPMLLVQDHPLGTWSWKWIDVNDDVVKTGTFEVVASPGSTTDASIAALTTKVTELTTAITSAGSKADAATAAATAAGVKSDAATAAATAAGTKADAAATAATSAAASAKSAADAVGGLTTLVYVAIAAGLLAAIAAIYAVMSIRSKIAG